MLVENVLGHARHTTAFSDPHLLATGEMRRDAARRGACAGEASARIVSSVSFVARRSFAFQDYDQSRVAVTIVSRGGIGHRQ